MIAPLWFPVWRSENTSGRFAGGVMRNSMVELAGVSGP